mmetsp:Transcript_41348/g.62999  ORF Transcript_41348/g.62999 Transcript_41348/m.62999 type:complete len:93 (-) Transcript_41348:748-1026(-)
MANFYFLLLATMELFKPISDANGVPVMALPLAFVVGISMIKDVYEDYQRHVSDREENYRNCNAAPVPTTQKPGVQSVPQRMEKTRWQDVKVG